VLIENPWLLEGGLVRHFRGWTIFQDAPEFSSGDDLENYRTVAVLRPMIAPSAETLKKYTRNWDNPEKEGATPPARIRWGNDEKSAQDEDVKISSVIGTKQEPTPAGNENASDLAGGLDNNPPEPGTAPEASVPESDGAIPKPAGKKDAITPPESEISEIEENVALNIAPNRIPDSIPQTDAAGTPDAITIFENEQQAIDRKGSGIFNTQGWPLKEYASLIKQRVTGNWMVPSNLRDSNEYTTIVFFIDRNGQHFDTHIVESSGNNSLNLTAMKAILDSNPFPPLPQGFPGDRVGVKYVFIPEPQ